MDRHPLRVLAVALLAVAGCLRTGDGKPPEPPPEQPPGAPSGLTIEPAAYWGEYQVRWIPPAEYISGYEIEGRAGAAGDVPFAKTHEGLLPADWTSAFLYAFDVPELVSIELRIRAVRYDLASGWSEVASIVQPLKAPLYVQASPTHAGGSVLPPIEVTWYPQSASTTEFLLERADADVDPAARTWIAFPPLPGSAVAYTDADVEDGRSYLYRLRGAAQGMTSAPVTSNATLNLDVLAPEITQVSLIAPAVDADPVGFRVSWVNRSASADAVMIERQDAGQPHGFLVAYSVPAAAGVYDDLEWPQWPGARYRVHAFRSGITAGEGSSGWLGAPWFTLHGPVTCDASTVEVPAGDQYLRDDEGGVHVLRGFPYDSTPALFRPAVGGHEEYPLDSNVWMLEPGLDVDPDGHPHVMFYAPVPFPGDGSRVVTHVWHDGSVWQRETVQLEATAELNGVFAAGPGGAVHLVYVRNAAGGTERVHALRENGAWTRTVLPSVTLVNPTYHLRVARDGTAYLALSAWPGTGGIALLTRPPGGGWAMEAVPGVEPFVRVWLVAGDAGRVGVFFERRQGLGEQFWYAGRDLAGFGAPALVAAGPFVGRELFGSTAMSPDGTRVALVVDLPDAGGAQHQELLVRDGAGTWAGQRIGPWSGALRLRFDAAGKLAVLVGMGQGFAETQVLPVLVER